MVLVLLRTEQLSLAFTLSKYDVYIYIYYVYVWVLYLTKSISILVYCHLTWKVLLILISFEFMLQVSIIHSFVAVYFAKSVSMLVSFEC
jgi:hypothetical protein